ncbi:MAG: molybdopterin-dependent oxidoreductase [Spirochaetes bacterium]|uniref:Molybdopterin-dependent oxidoreductase n=1 Tax=Candidatus Ornithospirochaeta stercoripullorum TaxID=2840899 RepID=A0A9D9E279_9SPIO|nr:molybdopterin-dependent oxidoreductase [Candidatus Ornithospirochaeta stercoripullorum]
MADRKNFSRYNMRCGILLHAKEGKTRISDLKLPELDSRYLVLTGSDLPGTNSISFMGRSMPLIAKETISYKDQIVLALFAPDYESAELMMREIQLSTEPLKEQPEAVTLPDSLEYSWGEMEENKEDKYREITTTFNLTRIARPNRKLYTVTAWMEGSNMHIEAPSQWVELIRDTVERATGYPKRNIIVHLLSYTAKHDEFLIEPAVLAAIAATATIRTGLPSEIREECYFSRPTVNVKRKVLLDEDMKPQFETAEMTIDQGAFAFAPEEYQRQAMTGLIPPYPLKGFRGSVKIISSPSHPASFCGSLGYSEALSSTEYHISRLAESAGMTPNLYRQMIEKDKRKFTDYIPGFDLTQQKKCMDKVVASSSFDRKWSANTFQKEDFGLLGYLKGIGMASGAGIAGFSTTLSKETGFSAMMTFTQKHNVTINTSALTHQGTMKSWKKRIAERIIPDRPEGVMFLDPGPDTIDSGPDVLSRLVASFTLQLESAAKRLSVLKDTEKLPVSIQFDAENTYYPCEFENSGYGAIVCEVVIDKATMIPQVKGIWASLSFPSIMDRVSLENSVRRTIMMTLQENGMSIPLSFHIDVEITEDGTDDTISSIQQLARGLTLGALYNALHQAVGGKADALPISDAEINLAFTGAEK